MSNIKYFVRTTKERVFNYPDLIYTELVDFDHEPIESF